MWPRERDNPVPSDSLLMLDLKSGSKLNIGTHAVMLEKHMSH